MLLAQLPKFRPTLLGVATAGLLAVSIRGAAEGPATARPIGLAEVARIALGRSPDVRLARLEVEKSRSDLALARAEGSLQAYGGSGLGATSGIPQSIQGAAPSAAQVTLRQPLLDSRRPRWADGAREMIRSGEYAATATAEESAYRATTLFLDLELATREIERLRLGVERLERIEGVVSTRVEEGVEIPLALSRSRLDTERARSRLASSEARASLLESDLRVALGFGPDVRLRPDPEGADTASVLRDAAARAVPRRTDDHPEVAALEARILAARHRARAARSERLPRLDIVGQYALLARFNNYDDYFRRFQRHNWQAGVALEVPLFTGRGVAERVGRARLDERGLRLQQEAKREAIELDGQRSYAVLREAERLRRLARLELDYARENLDVVLARFEEGRIALDELERARELESSAWGGLLESQYALARAQLRVVYAAGAIQGAFAD